jgi:hypothetical protein
LYEIENNFDFKNPAKHLPDLMEAHKMILNLEDDHWRKIKEKEIVAIIEACAGLYLEVSAVSSSATPNSKINVDIEILNRSNIPVRLTSITSTLDKITVFKGIDLVENTKLEFTESIFLPTDKFSTPYWLENEGSLGMYKVDDQKLIGKPETPSETKIEFDLVINYMPITITKNIVRRYSKSDKGEIYEPFEILPKVTTKLTNKVILFSDSIVKKVTVEVRAGASYINGFVSLELPNNWLISPNKIPFNIAQKNDKQIVEFYVTAPKEESEGKLKVIATLDGETFDKELIEINYDHIPKQSVLVNSEAKIVRLNIKKAGDKIGYIKGAGDAVPESLRQIGYTVDEINPADINEDNLKNYDAIVLGIRAYNVVKELKFKQKYLLEYVEKGGNMIVQYNTNRGVDVGAPYKLSLSRDRVTDEFADVTILDSNHELLNYPNKITEEDFKDWVQERGLYFPNAWDPNFTPLLSMYDKGELPKNGSLLIAKYGKGNYIYTGLSFFRELPAGVSGAYKLFANMLSVKGR